MALEYLLLLFVSALLLAGSFGMETGPVKMFAESSPKLAHHLERRLTTGEGFFDRDKGTQRYVGWRR